ncbi:hypothetical protein [Methanocella sp. MCL-LM]|uniref:hypothetical protein n=1 Tax=Methanocella sp. MCL-LM TaxID=3412035 RepID=UPI003C71C51D
MKLRIMIITALLALLLVAPAYAADRIYYAEPAKLVDDNGIEIQIKDVKVSDMPTGYSIFNYPPSQYQFYTISYWIANPTDERIKYQFKINFVDEKGRVYTSEEFNLAGNIDPNKKLLDMMQYPPTQKEFAVYRNATGVYLQWEHIDRYLNEMKITNISLVQEAAPTATVTPVPTATAAPAATPTATPVPTATPGSQPCLPFLPMALIAGGFGTVGLIYNRMGRR